MKPTFMKIEPHVLLSTLWIFVTVNYIFCDVVSGMESAVVKGYLAGQLGNLVMNQQFLLAASVMMEIPFVMILLARLLPHRINRWANVGAAVFMTLVQVGSLFFGTAPALHYVFYSVVENSTTVAIVAIAWRWRAIPLRSQITEGVDS